MDVSCATEQKGVGYEAVDDISFRPPVIGLGLAALKPTVQVLALYCHLISLLSPSLAKQ